MPAYREKVDAVAQYEPGSVDGERPGTVQVNTATYTYRNVLSIESTAYHEGVPGHHMQMSIAQELTGLPSFRQHEDYTAYVEGWALSAEWLGKELGFYKDPYSEFGRLDNELLRASRLVVDTGVHFKRWKREQMIAYLREHSGENDADIQLETDRYIAVPAQALSYTLGQMKFLELRSRAQRQLGSLYDVRKFHDEMLNGGALPLDVLETRTDRWIAATKAGR